MSFEIRRDAKNSTIKTYEYEQIIRGKIKQEYKFLFLNFQKKNFIIKLNAKYIKKI